MIKDLIVTFGKGDGSTHNWTYKGLDPNLSAPEIKEACELLTNLDISTQNGVKLFDSVVTAKVRTHIETVMFDPEHETKGVTYYGEPARESTCEEVGCFAVVDEPKEVKETVQNKAKMALLSPVLPLMDYTKQPQKQSFKKMMLEENTENSVKVEKDSLPPLKRNIPCERLTREPQKLDFPSTADSAQSPEKSAKERNGLLRWIHKIRKRNKEDPTFTPRE